jgi:nucleolar protein 4
VVSRRSNREIAEKDSAKSQEGVGGLKRKRDDGEKPGKPTGKMSRKDRAGGKTQQGSGASAGADGAEGSAVGTREGDSKVAQRTRIIAQKRMKRKAKRNGKA